MKHALDNLLTYLKYGFSSASSLPTGNIVGALYHKL